MILGDLNDAFDDGPNNNVFQPFLNRPQRYRFANRAIAEGPSPNWSYPTWPSHLDHIVLTRPLFEALERAGSQTRCLRIGDYLPGGWTEYETYVSDHRPVGLKLAVSTPTSQAAPSDASGALRLRPTYAHVDVDLPSNHTDASLVLYDAMGRLLRRMQVPDGRARQRILLEDVPRGLVVVQLREADGRISSARFFRP